MITRVHRLKRHLAVVGGLVFALAPAGMAVEIETVFVGDAGNAPDGNSFGAVDHEFAIGKYEVTEAEWDAYVTRNTGSSTDQRPRVRTVWVDMARFANWLHNGQPDTGGTETGAYTIPDGIGDGYNPLGAAIVREPGARWAIASENEWYGSAWTKKSYAFPAASLGKNVKVEFNFASDSNSEEWAGFYIDDVEVTGP